MGAHLSRDRVQFLHIVSSLKQSHRKLQSVITRKKIHSVETASDLKRGGR